MFILWDMSGAVKCEAGNSSIKINNAEEIQEAGLSRPELAKQVTHIILQMVFEDGLFHSDLHPGNIFVRSEGQIGLIDFGWVGTVDGRNQQQLSAVLLTIGMLVSERLSDAILVIAVTLKLVDRMLLQATCSDLSQFSMASH